MGRARAVRETDLGIYVWQKADGDFVADDELNILSVQAFRGDLRAISNIAAVARNIGFGEGQAVFVEGARKIDQEEWEEQRYRQSIGLQADPYDIKIFKENLRNQ